MIKYHKNLYKHKLFTSHTDYVDYEEVRYYVEDTIDFCYIDNVIYFIFSANTNNDLDEFDSTLFVKYIIKTKVRCQLVLKHILSIFLRGKSVII